MNHVHFQMILLLGYIGAISRENVANITVQESSFDNCKASYGGSVSVKSGSTLKVEHSNLIDSSAINAGGGLYIFQNSFVTGQNTNINSGKHLVVDFMSLSQVKLT